MRVHLHFKIGVSPREIIFDRINEVIYDSDSLLLYLTGELVGQTYPMDKIDQVKIREEASK